MSILKYVPIGTHLPYQEKYTLTTQKSHFLLSAFIPRINTTAIQHAGLVLPCVEMCYEQNYVVDIVFFLLPLHFT